MDSAMVWKNTTCHRICRREWVGAWELSGLCWMAPEGSHFWITLLRICGAVDHGWILHGSDRGLRRRDSGLRVPRKGLGHLAREPDFRWIWSDLEVKSQLLEGRQGRATLIEPIQLAA
jgi:hypothetical protein